MNKYFILLASILVLASCAKDGNDNEDVKDSLTPVTLGVTTNMDNAQTRVVWSNPEGQAGNQTIGVKFEPGEKMDVFELDCSGKHVFTNIDTQAYQSGNFSGEWHKEGTHWAAILPSSGNNSVTMTESQNVYNVTIPASQTAFTNVYTSGISPDINANYMIAAKSDHAAQACFLSPVCAYLYFATNSAISTVKIKTTTTPIAGKLTITTATNWESWGSYIDTKPSLSTTSNVHEITATGVKTSRNTTVGELTEYIVCILPGTYAAGDIQITTTDGTVLKTSGKEHTFNAVNLYYLGVVGN